jgi:hypothetical protein
MGDSIDRSGAAETFRKPRVLGAGRCNAFLVSGKVKLACTCQTGTFELRNDGKDIDTLLCQFCCHLLGEHVDFPCSEEADISCDGE